MKTGSQTDIQSPLPPRSPFLQLTELTGYCSRTAAINLRHVPPVLMQSPPDTASSYVMSVSCCSCKNRNQSFTLHLTTYSYRPSVDSPFLTSVRFIKFTKGYPSLNTLLSLLLRKGIDINRLRVRGEYKLVILISIEV